METSRKAFSLRPKFFSDLFHRVGGLARQIQIAFPDRGNENGGVGSDGRETDHRVKTVALAEIL
jgi:hypothetical protein